MEQVAQKPSLKLNYKRTALIGFAFFGICLLWQVYDTWCPPFLTDIFARNLYNLTAAELNLAVNEAKRLEVQWLVGIIMACDNLAALILLPIFGHLSDKAKTPIGKRMPFILIGTFVAATVFPFIPLLFHLNKVAGMVIMMAIILMFMMMYRNPAVSLMPDMTPKPLRAKANGIINIMGYFGGAFAAVLSIVLQFSSYILLDEAGRAAKFWTIEIPFVVASVLMAISAIVLFFTVKENKIAEEVREQMEEGERLAELANPVEEDKPLTKANKIMLWGILIAEFFWFMADNALGTYLSNYVVYYMHAASGNAGTLTIAGGVASVVGFAIAGFIADKIGRKWTVSIGLGISLIALITMIFVLPKEQGADGIAKLPMLMYPIFILKGFGMALVHNCSFPMVVELATGKTVGKFTSFYYGASMSAQTITPVLLGLIFKATLAWRALPIYISSMTLISALVFVIIVKNVKGSKGKNVKGLEALGADD